MVKNSSTNAGDTRETGSIPGSGRSPGGGHVNPLQSSCLENPMEAGAWEATVHGVAKSPTRLSDFTFTFFHFPGGTVVKHPPANGSDLGEACLIPGSGRSPGGGNSNPLQ